MSEAEPAPIQPQPVCKRRLTVKTADPEQPPVKKRPGAKTADPPVKKRSGTGGSNRDTQPTLTNTM
eukprot:5107283-Karenia_brevis.AAC.1